MRHGIIPEKGALGRAVKTLTEKADGITRRGMLNIISILLLVVIAMGLWVTYTLFR